MRVDAGYFFPRLGDHGDIGTLGVEPPDTYNNVILTASQCAHMQWLAKTAHVYVTGTWPDDPPEAPTPVPFSFDFPVTLRTQSTYDELHGDFVGGSGGWLRGIAQDTVVFDSVPVPYYFALGAYYGPGTEAEPDFLSDPIIHRMVDSLGAENSTTRFIVPSTFYMGNSGGTTVDTVGSSAAVQIGTCGIYSDGAPVSISGQVGTINWSMSYPLFDTAIVQGPYSMLSLDVEVEITAWLTAPAV